MAPGSVLIVHTTGSPRTAEAIAARARPSTWSTPRSAADRTTSPRATSRCSSAATTTPSTRVQPVLSAYGDPILHVGAHRCGPAGEARQQHAVRRADRAGRRGRAARRRGSASTKSTLLDALTHGSAAEPGAGHDRRRGLRRRPSSTRSANSSARTSPWSGRPSPNWAAISALSTTSSTPGLRRMRQRSVECHHSLSSGQRAYC